MVDNNDAPKKFWFEFGNESIFDEIACGDDSSVANKVLETYNIDCATPTIGGSLRNLDIKHMDAMQAIRLSLMEEAKDGSSIYEAIVNEDGEVEFVNVGNNSSSLNPIYYTIQTKNYIEECKGVLVTGGKPFPVRKAVDWKPIWGDDGPDIYDTQLMQSTCIKAQLDQWCTIVYNDPHFDSQFEDGIDNLYDITVDNAWDRIIGYAYYIDPGDLVGDDTTIAQQKPSEIPIYVGSEVGELERPPRTSDPNQDCWMAAGSTIDGIEIPIPADMRFESVRGTTVDKFLGVVQVYIVGMALTVCKGVPESDEVTQENTEDKNHLWIAADDLSPGVFRCSEGVHYLIQYPEDPSGGENPRIVFANQARSNDNAKVGDEAYYRVLPGCHFYDQGYRSGTATILPTGGMQGVMVNEIWVVIRVDTPSFIINDPYGGNAREIAENLKVLVTPLVIEEAPAPVAFNGSDIDLVPGKQDHDPTTQQNFDETDLERAYDEMEGGGMSLTFSFFDADEVRELSQAIYEYMNHREGIETTYVCGPSCNPKLGTRGPAGGIINNITYSYNDSSSYTISVNEGGWLVGNFAEISGNVYTKAVEEASAQGTIIQDLGNHIHYKVNIDGYGVRTAFNCCPRVLRVGDKVNVAVHNNPVEQ